MLIRKWLFSERQRDVWSYEQRGTYVQYDKVHKIWRTTTWTSSECLLLRGYDNSYWTNQTVFQKHTKQKHDWWDVWEGSVVVLEYEPQRVLIMLSSEWLLPAWTQLNSYNHRHLSQNISNETGTVTAYEQIHILTFVHTDVTDWFLLNYGFYFYFLSE